MSTTLAGAVSGGPPNTFDKPVTVGKTVSLSASYSFTSPDTAGPYIDLRGASRVRVLLDAHLAGAFSLDLESSADGSNSAGMEVTGITTAQPQQLDGPFGWMRARLPSLASGTLVVVFFVQYQ